MWSVLKTKCPVSAAFNPISTVSLSRISPTRIISGSCLKKDLNAVAKLKPISSLIWTCPTPSSSYSTGSSAEDPVEYELDGVGQVQIKDDIGFNFATALRSFLRQDPEIILVGEMRDKETVDIGLKAALTGHLVFSTLHTNDAPSTITRLQNMGTPDYLISAAALIK